ncbi:MAG: tetratricopeptide repeat protein [Bdellovibrionales bacterium]|nr:tetratricopeptide repeat protein [Bdellovibrionales bacterium]
MNFRQSSLIFAVVCTSVVSLISLSSCVTTRQQMNEEKGISDESASATSAQPQSNSVKSEDISKPDPVVQTFPPSPVAQTPPVTAPVPSNNNGDGKNQTVLVPATTAASTPTVATGSGGSYTMDEIRSEMARLTGKVDELEHEKQIREVERTEEQKKLQEKIATLEKQLQEKADASVPKIPEGKTPFEAGKDAYFNEHYEEAVVYLDKAISIKDTGKEAEEAFYIRGECKFKLKNYQAAIIDYSKFPEKFPKSSYHPKALLRIAESFDAMGLKDDGKAFYQNLVDQFPKTAEGKLAKKRLSAPAKKK